MSSESEGLRKDGGVQAPIGIGGMFYIPDSDDDEGPAAFENTSEIQDLVIGSLNVKVRQYSWHEANANQVWPGTFALVKFLQNSGGRYDEKCLELGSATGALAICMRISGHTEIATCDIDDAGFVAENIRFNEELNGLSPGSHIPHTWGTGWEESLSRLPSEVRDKLEVCLPFKYIIASDILLYVSAYPALVTTLRELFASGQVVEFLMAWNRRISASASFFEMMRAQGFRCHHHGHCVYSFYTEAGAAADPYLAALQDHQGTSSLPCADSNCSSTAAPCC